MTHRFLFEIRLPCFMKLCNPDAKDFSLMASFRVHPQLTCQIVPAWALQTGKHFSFFLADISFPSLNFCSEIIMVMFVLQGIDKSLVRFRHSVNEQSNKRDRPSLSTYKVTMFMVEWWGGHEKVAFVILEHFMHL